MEVSELDKAKVWRSPRRHKAKVGRQKCPLCGALNWAIRIEQSPEGERGVCATCGGKPLRSEWTLVEVDAYAYYCPFCGEEVSDTPENYSFSTWGGPEPVVLCPRCEDHPILHGYIHHESADSPSVDVDVPEKGGYFYVFHKGCPKAENGLGHMVLKRLCVDPETRERLRRYGASRKPYSPYSRVVLVYVCASCGQQQVLKASLGDIRIWNAYEKSWWRSRR